MNWGWTSIFRSDRIAVSPFVAHADRAVSSRPPLHVDYVVSIIVFDMLLS